jgi:hypothetical protein
MSQRFTFLLLSALALPIVACGTATTSGDGVDGGGDSDGGSGADAASGGGPDATVTTQPDAAVPTLPDAAPALVCDPGTCALGGVCVGDIPDFGYEPGPVGSRWFGGDDRDLNGDGVIDIRNVGAGESFAITDPIAVSRVALEFETGFASAATNTPHAVIVAVQLRDASGAVLASADRAVPDSFTGGVVTWDLAATIPAGTYVLTAFVRGVFAGSNYTSAIRTDFAAAFPGGTAYAKELTPASSGTMSDWDQWQADPGADHAFGIDAGCPL